MAIYSYVYQGENTDIDTVKSAVSDYLAQRNMSLSAHVEEADASLQHWQDRKIGVLINNPELKANDIIVVYDAHQLARSAGQVLEILTHLTNKGVNLHFVKYNQIFEAKTESNLFYLLDLLHNIEEDFVLRRTQEAAARRRAAGLPLGRPRGSKNKSLKLDKYKKDIVRYLDLSISKASIAKLVNCHPQTLYDWIERNQVPDKRPIKSRSKSQSEMME